MTSPDAMLAAAREAIAPTFVEVVARQRARLEQRGRGPLKESVELLAVAVRLYRWRRRHKADDNPSASRQL